MQNDAEKLKVEKAIFRETVKQMKNLGVYRKEYDHVIRVYAQLRQQYDFLTERLEKSNFKVQTAAAQGGMKKAPLVSVLENLRKDILAYSDRLCLNPKAFDAMNIKPEKKSGLESALRMAERDG